MLTIEDVSAVPLFSALAAADRERLARTSADIRLAPGEFAVHEGGEPALFAVLSGKIEVIKTVDGIERRSAGAFPAPFSVKCRSRSARRFRRISRRRTIARHARRASGILHDRGRIEGSVAEGERAGARAHRGIADHCRRPHKPRVTVVGPRWDPATADLRRFLARNQITFDWLSPDAPELSRLFPETRCRWRPPAMRLADGQVLVSAGARPCTSPRPADPRRGRLTTTRSHRRRAGRPGGCGLRRIRGAAHDRHRARGARRPGGHLLADRELSRLSQRGFR